MKKQFKLKIKDRKRFACFISLVIVFVMTTALISILQTTVRGKAEKSYIEVYIQPGDTLWEIADKYNDRGIDIRKFVYNIMTENNMKTAMVYQNQTVKIPIE